MISPSTRENQDREYLHLYNRLVPLWTEATQPSQREDGRKNASRVSPSSAKFDFPAKPVLNRHFRKKHIASSEVSSRCQKSKVIAKSLKVKKQSVSRPLFLLGSSPPNQLDYCKEGIYSDLIFPLSSYCQKPPFSGVFLPSFPSLTISASNGISSTRAGATLSGCSLHPAAMNEVVSSPTKSLN